MASFDPPTPGPIRLTERFEPDAECPWTPEMREIYKLNLLVGLLCVSRGVPVSDHTVEFGVRPALRRLSSDPSGKRHGGFLQWLNQTAGPSEAYRIQTWTRLRVYAAQTGQSIGAVLIELIGRLQAEGGQVKPPEPIYPVVYTWKCWRTGYSIPDRAVRTGQRTQPSTMNGSDSGALGSVRGTTSAATRPETPREPRTGE